MVMVTSGITWFDVFNSGAFLRQILLKMRECMTVWFHTAAAFKYAQTFDRFSPASVQLGEQTAVSGL